MATVIVAIIIFGSVAGIIYRMIKQYRRGESGCGCGCSHCSSSKTCSSSKADLSK